MRRPGVEMIATMISGQVHSKNSRTTRAGNPMMFLKVRVPSGNNWQLWNVAVFDAALIAQLENIDEGTPISAVGPSSAEIYQAKGSGEPRISFHLTAEKLLTLR
jgi:hypothetical protein